MPYRRIYRSTRLFDAMAAGALEMTGAELTGLGLPFPALPPESAIIVALRRVE